MKCPYCGYTDSKVIDSRDVNDGVRRRRQCLSCNARFTTYERLQPASLFIIKKDQRREEFNREKLLGGIRKACEKRPLPTGAIEKITDEIEAGLYKLGKAEITQHPDRRYGNGETERAWITSPTSGSPASTGSSPISGRLKRL